MTQRARICHVARRSLASPRVRTLLLAFLAAVVPGRRVLAQETFTRLAPVKMSTTTGEKPQSKVWFHDERWWAVLASKSVTPTGTWLWRLDSDNVWRNVLRLSPSTSAKADALALGGVTHVLLQESSGQLVSVQYDPVQHTYVPWPENPNPTPVNLSGSETATIDVDSTDRLWLATESGSHILVWYSDYPYRAFAGPISLAGDVSSDDISVVTALPFRDPPAVGVLWSDQHTERFGFRLHVDGTDPLVWLPDEVPASQSARNVGGGMGDDHLNVKVGADGTLYAAVKTSYDTSSQAHVAFLVRRPSGLWDDLYYVHNDGTRGIILLNEPANLLRYVYENSGSIYYRDSQISSIRFGSERTLMTGSLNDPTSTKLGWADQVVVLAYGQGVLMRLGATTTTSVTATTSTTPTTSTTTSTTLPPGAVVVDLRIATRNDDAEESAGGSVSLTSSDLELVEDGSLQTVGLRFPGVAIPPGATILTAWVQFEVDETSSQATSLRIQGEAADDAAPFATTTRNLSGRPRTSASAEWSPPAWTSVGTHGPDQRTPELAAVVQEIVGRPSWASGRALALLVTGTGRRVARTYDGAPAGAALLHVAYTGGATTTTTTSTTTTTLPTGLVTFERRVAASQDDAEEALSGRVVLGSSDLELVEDGDPQTVGLRFGNVTIPPGAVVVAAWVQFQVDEATTVATTLRIEGEASDDALPFVDLSQNVSARPRTTAFSVWAPPGWSQTDVAGLAQRSADIAAVIQEIVARPTWSSGRALALIVTGTGKRVAEAWDGVPAAAPLLHVEYTVP